MQDTATNNEAPKLLDMLSENAELKSQLAAVAQARDESREWADKLVCTIKKAGQIKPLETFDGMDDAAKNGVKMYNEARRSFRETLEIKEDADEPASNT